MGEQINLWFNNDELKKIVELAGITDKSEVTKWIKEKSLTDFKATIMETNGKKSLDELKRLELTIKCWKGLLDIRDSVPFKIDPMAIITGQQELQAPTLTMLTSGNTETSTDIQNPNKISWLHFCKVGNKERETAIGYKCGYCGEVDSYGK